MASGMPSKLATLMRRGDHVAVEHGRLVIKPLSGKAVTNPWMKQNQRPMVADIAKLMGMEVFEYQGFIVGRFGEHKQETARLAYSSLLTGADCSAFFNVILTKARNTKSGKKGEQLKGKRFRVNENFRFFKFWQSLGLETPRRLSEWHDHMGKLKPVYVNALINENQKLINESIEPFSVNHSEIEERLAGKRPDNSPTTSRQFPDNSPTRSPDKENPQNHANQGLQATSSTCVKKYVLSNQVSTCKGSFSPPLSNPYGELEKAPVLPVEHKQPQDQSVDEWLADYKAASATEYEKPIAQPEPPYESIPQNIRDWMEKNLADHAKRIANKSE